MSFSEEKKEPAKEGETNKKVKDKVSKIAPSVQRFIITTLICIVSIHYVACIWSNIGDFEDHESWKQRKWLDNQSFIQQYVTAVYWTTQTLFSVGFGDVGQATTTEKWFSVLWMVVGLFLYSFFISSIHTYLNFKFQKKQSIKRFNDSLYFLKTKFKISSRLIRQTRIIVEKNQLQFSKEENEIFFQQLPHVVRNELLYHISRNKINTFWELRGFGKEFYGMIGPKLQTLKLEKGDVIFEKGDIPNMVYLMV